MATLGLVGTRPKSKMHKVIQGNTRNTLVVIVVVNCRTLYDCFIFFGIFWGTFTLVFKKVGFAR